MFRCSSAHKLLVRANSSLLLAPKSRDGAPFPPPLHSPSGLLAFLKRKCKELELQRDRTLDTLETINKAERQRMLFGASDPEGWNEAGTSQGGGNGGRSPSSTALPCVGENRLPCPRSALFVSCSSSRALQKIRDTAADCLILDLEEGVPPSAKREARDRLRDFVGEMEKAQQAGDVGAGKRLMVRINSPDFDAVAAMLDLELVGVLGTAIEGIAIPKITTKTYELIKDYVHPDHKLWAFFELPISVLHAPTICLSGKYTCAVMGYNRLAAEMHLPSRVSAALSDSSKGWKRLHCLDQGSPLGYAVNQVLFSARAANMFAIDGVYNDPSDKLGFRQDLSRCQALGFDGKCLIHSDQIAPTHESFIPSRDEVEWAIHVKEEIARAGHDTPTLDGMVIEGLHARQAGCVLALYRMAEKERQESEAAATTGSGLSSSSGEDSHSSTNDSLGTTGRKSRRRKPTDHRTFP